MFSLFSGPKKPLSSKAPSSQATVAANTSGEARVMKRMLEDRAAELPKGNMGSNFRAFASETNIVGMKGVGAQKRTVTGNTRNLRNWKEARREANATINAAKGGYRKTRRNRSRKTRR